MHGLQGAGGFCHPRAAQRQGGGHHPKQDLCRGVCSPEPRGAEERPAEDLHTKRVRQRGQQQLCGRHQHQLRRGDRNQPLAAGLRRRPGGERKRRGVLLGQHAGVLLLLLPAVFLQLRSRARGDVQRVRLPGWLHVPGEWELLRDMFRQHTAERMLGHRAVVLQQYPFPHQQVLNVRLPCVHCLPRQWDVRGWHVL